MRRHLLLAAARLALACALVPVLPWSHNTWGETPPGDGQEAMAFQLVYLGVGFAAAALFAALGSLGQFLLRRRPAALSLAIDLALFALAAAALAYGGITAHYGATAGNAHATSARSSA
jgi:hypothetical protein